MTDHHRPITSGMPDCIIEHFPIIGVGDMPHALFAWINPPVPTPVW
jgi:hypothetical protein